MNKRQKQIQEVLYQSKRNCLDMIDAHRELLLGIEECEALLKDGREQECAEKYMEFSLELQKTSTMCAFKSSNVGG